MISIRYLKITTYRHADVHEHHMEGAHMAQSIFVDPYCVAAISGQSNILVVATNEECLQELEVDFVVIHKQDSRLARLVLAVGNMPFTPTTHKLIVLLHRLLLG